MDQQRRIPVLGERTYQPSYWQATFEIQKPMRQRQANLLFNDCIKVEREDAILALQPIESERENNSAGHSLTSLPISNPTTLPN